MAPLESTASVVDKLGTLSCGQVRIGFLIVGAFGTMPRQIFSGQGVADPKGNFVFRAMTDDKGRLIEDGTGAGGLSELKIILSLCCGQQEG